MRSKSLSFTQSVPFAPRLKALVAALGLTLLASAPQAAQHPLSKINYDTNRNVNVMDMVLSIDWDFDTPPAGRDKAFLEGIIRQASQSLFTMTEGRQMLGTVSVYKNSQFMSNTDIQYLQKDGRANAHTAGFTTGKSYRVQQFAGTGETPVDHGKTVAHELGHYILGLSDEYREVGGTSTEAGSPQDGDTPRDTIMNSHLGFLSISTADDYADSANQKTAQFRSMGKSAWELITSEPATDKTNIDRLLYQPFKNMTPPTKASLTKPTTGWENDLKIVYMGADAAAAPSGAGNGVSSRAAASTASGPINMIVIDTTVSPSALTAQLNAAAKMVDAAGKTNRIAVFAHPFASAPIVPITSLATDANRATVKQAIAKITAATASDDKTAGDRIFDWAETQLPSFFPAGTTSLQNIPGWTYRLYRTGKAVGVSGGNLYYYDGVTLAPLGATAPWLAQARGNLSASLQKALDALKVVRKPSDTPFVSLFTSATQTVDSGLVNAFRAVSVAINPIVLKGSSTATGASAVTSTARLRSTVAGQTSMFDFAKGTMGTFKEAGNAADLSKVAEKAGNTAEGDEIQTVNEDDIATLTPSQSHTMSAVLAGGGVDTQAVFNAFSDVADADKVNFSLTTPNGTVITPSSLPNGVSYTANPAEGVFSYTVPSGYANFAGTWKSTTSTTATAGTAGFVAQSVEVASLLGLGLDVVGGTVANPHPMKATVEVSGPIAIEGAKVTADIVSLSTGATVKTGLVLLDNGKGADVKAGDGIYSISLADLPVGEYEIHVKAMNDGTAVYTTAGNTKQGMNAPAQAVPAFQRMVVDAFVKE